MAVVVMVLIAGGLALAPLSAGSREIVYVTPPGTLAANKTGKPLELLPAEIHLTLGVRDVLVLTNDDSAVHYVGPIALASRQTYRIPAAGALPVRVLTSRGRTAHHRRDT